MLMRLKSKCNVGVKRFFTLPRGVEFHSEVWLVGWLAAEMALFSVVISAFSALTFLSEERASDSQRE